MKIWHALKQYKQLPYTFIYLFSFFLLADVSLQLILAPHILSYIYPILIDLRPLLIT